MFLLFIISFVLSQLDSPLLSVWPSVVALLSVLLLRKALSGLLIGAVCGVILIAEGNPIHALFILFYDVFSPALSSSWNLSVLAFTLLLGGFASLLEKGDGFEKILNHWLKKRGNLSKKVEWSAFLLGIICFFDGLASSLLTGRAIRPLADKTGLSRVKLAYLVDSTGSAIACVAIMSTWIAYQLSMIREGYLAAEILHCEPFTLFLSSIPRNFYCWFTLVLVILTIRKSLNLGSMKKFENTSCDQLSEPDHTKKSNEKDDNSGKSRVFIPLITLIGCLFLGLYMNGVDGVAWPLTFMKIKQAFGDAQSNLVLLYSSIIACIVAYLFNRIPFQCRVYPQRKNSLRELAVFSHLA